MKSIRTTAAPAPAGHYSQATSFGELVFVSGQLGVLPDGTHAADASFAEQVRRAVAHVLAIAAEAGCTKKDILRVSAYIVGIERWPEFNSIYAELLGEVRPARTVVPVPALHYGYLIEIDAILGRPAR